MKVVTRFPPSPTGYFHIGSARTALFNYLFAAHHGGTMYLRFEDTDRARSKPEYEADILEGLHWLGIGYTLPSVYRQSERTPLYTAAIKSMLDSGAAYESEEPAKDDPARMVRVIRLRNPGEHVDFDDLIRGQVTFHTGELGDFVIARSIDDPLYHLAVVIDDHDMGVTHILRGEDHISNTARQILVFRALGFTPPEYAHIPLILAPDRSKLSKRHGAVSVNEYRADGFIPESIVNYLALLGWNPGGEQEIFSLDQLAALFDISRIHKGGAVFDKEKLLWFNHEHLKALPDDEYVARMGAFGGPEIPADAVALLKERARTLKETSQLFETEFGFLSAISYEPELLLQKGKIPRDVASQHLKTLATMLATPAESEFTAHDLKELIWPYATAQGRGNVLWPLRTALSGAERSPDPFIIASLIGKEKVLQRISAAITALETV